MSLRRALKKPNSESLTKIITSRVLEMTRCIKLATLNIHCYLSNFLRTKTDEEIDAYFGRFTDKNLFNDFFFGVCWTERSGYELYPEIKTLCDRYGVRAPKIAENTGNLVNYASQTYFTNFKNNIWQHAYQRLKRFFSMHTCDKDMIYDTLHFLFNTDSDKIPNENLIEAIRIQLKPMRFGNGKGYFHGMNSSKWFKYVPVYMRLQK